MREIYHSNCITSTLTNESLIEVKTTMEMGPETICIICINIVFKFLQTKWCVEFDFKAIYNFVCELNSSVH